MMISLTLKGCVCVCVGEREREGVSYPRSAAAKACSYTKKNMARHPTKGGVVRIPQTGGAIALASFKIFLSQKVGIALPKPYPKTTCTIAHSCN